ncbi:MAG: PrsW family glutamic-type intramembrane protease [Bacteroidales bacterium]|nr:PrsW family glutamic-type intramembrane protease [Bacteroidales bacterium]
MANAILLAISVLPVILLLIFIYRKDKFEKEPVRLLTKAFFFGILAVLAVLALPIPTANTGSVFFDALWTAFLNAAIPEELMKFLFLYLCIWINKEFDEYFDGIVYAVFLSLGFACVENIMYVFSSPDFAASIHTGIVRALLSVPAHFLFAVIMGYYFSLARFQPDHRVKYLWYSLLGAILAHGTFDFCLFFSENLKTMNLNVIATVVTVLFYVFNFILWKAAIKRINHLQTKQ